MLTQMDSNTGRAARPHRIRCGFGRPSETTFTCVVRNWDRQQNRCWRRGPPHCGQTLCICINSGLSHRLANPGFGALFPSKTNGMCPPELCVAWRKLVQMSAFLFCFSCKNGRMLGRRHNHMVFISFESRFSGA